MSLNKNEFEYMRLYAQKCDHRNMAPVASFGLAADLRANKSRGGRMFEKRKQRSDKYVFDDSHDHFQEPEQDSFQRPKHFAPQPAVWKPPSQTSGQIPDMEMMDRMNQNHYNARDNARPADDHLSDAERLQKLYRVLRYVPPEDAAQKKRPMKTPKANLRSKSHLTLLSGRDFNRNARGWCAVEGELQETAISTPSSEQIPEFLTPGMDNNYYYSATDLSPGSQDPYMYHEDKPRPKSWHSVRMEDFALQEDEFPMGDYNPRPKAWEPQYDDVDYPRRSLGPFGDYNPRPKAWFSNEAEDILGKEVQYGDYNPRPKAWRSKHRKRKDQPSYGDYNARPRAWQSSERGHYQSQVKDPASELKFGDYNPRPKAWKSPERSVRRKVRYGDYNPRPKAWRSAPEDDSSSTGSYSSAESSDDDYSYGSSLYLPGYIPACDV